MYDCAEIINFAMNGAGRPFSIHTMDGVGAPVEVQERVTDGGTPSITDITESLLAVVVASTAQCIIIIIIVIKTGRYRNPQTIVHVYDEMFAISNTFYCDKPGGITMISNSEEAIS